MKKLSLGLAAAAGMRNVKASIVGRDVTPRRLARRPTIHSVIVALFVTFMMHATVFSAETPTDGDYRSKASGNWSAAGTWQVRSVGAWGNAGGAPTSANNVYIQSNHTVTVDSSTVGCNNLELNTAGVLAIGANTLQVSGKLRAYTGSAVTSSSDGSYTGTSATTLNGTMLTSTSGELSVVGNSRSLTLSGEWGAQTTGVAMEIAVNAGQTVTLGTNIKGKSWNIATGNIDCVAQSIGADDGSTGGNITIASGATVIASSSGAGSPMFQRTGSTVGGILTVNGLLQISGANPCAAMSTINGSGTIEFTKAGAQNIGTAATSGGATFSTFANLKLSGSGTKTPVGSGSYTVNGTLTMAGTASFSLGSATLTYGGSSTLEYAGTVAQTNAVAEFPASGGPNSLKINNASGVTLSAPRTVNGTLTLTSGNLTTTGANLLTLGSSAAISGGSASSYVSGPLARMASGTGSKSFPIGKNSNYRPLTINFTALTGTSMVQAEQNDPGTFPGSSSGVTSFASRYWTVTESGSSARTYDITLDGTGFSPVGTGVILKYDNPTTTKLIASFSSPNYTATGLTSFSDFGLGDEALTNVSIDNTGTPTAGNVTAGANDVLLFGFRLSPSASVDFTGLSLTTAGSATSSDLSNFRVVYDADNSGTYNGGDSLVSGAGLALANPITFTIAGQTGINAARRYLVIADVAGGATVGRTFTGSIATAGDVTTTGTESGTAAGTQMTIQAASTPTITVSAGTLAFGIVTQNLTSAEQTYTVSGANLTDNITITAPSGFAVSTNSGAGFGSPVTLIQTSGSVPGTTIYARFSPTLAQAYSNDITHTSAGVTTQNVVVTGTGVYSSASDIIRDNSFTEPSNIDYTAHQEADLTSASLQVGSFKIRDGADTADADSASTTLDAITFTVANGANLRRVALYDGTTEVAEVAGGPTVTFSGPLGLAAPDGGSKTFKVLASFNSTVTDQQQVQFTVSSATANSGGSTFAEPDAGGAATDTTGDANRIAVTATKLVFSTPPPSSVRINQNFSATVQAQDANNNVDLDSTAAVAISKATGSGTLTGGSAQNLVTGSKTFDALQFDTAGTNTLQATADGLDNATSGDIIVLPPFTAGNLVVERMEGLSNSGTVVSCVEYDTSGTLMQTITLPNATNRPSANPFNLMDSGSATSNGQLTRSADGTKIVMPGYNGTNNEASIAGSSAATVSRTIGVIGTDGTVDTSRSYNMLSGDNFRSVASTDGTVFWAAGAGGVVYVNAAGTLATLSTTNTRCINIFNNQLYFSTGSGTVGIYSLGSGLPTSGSPTPTLLFSLNSGNGSPYAFAINSDSTMAYVGDTAGIYKYTYSADAWSYQYTLNTGFKSTSLTVDFSGPSPVIYATAGNTGGNSLVTITDTGSGSSATTLATAGAGQVFRGVAFAPQNPGPAITITNPATGSVPVPYATNIYSIAGTSSNAVGSLLWTNTLTSSNGTLAAGATWSVADIALDVGANAITVSGTNASGTAASATVTITRQPASLDGGGTAVLKNAGTDALTNSVIFCRGQSGQTAALTVTGAVWHTLKAVAVDLPAFFTGLDSNNVSLAGTGFPTGATWSVAGQTLTVTNAALTDTQPGVITIGGLTTGTPALTNDTSEQTWMVRTAEDSDLTAIASSPKAYITLPLAMLRGVDVNGIPVRSNQTVAVEGTCIVSNGTFSTSQLTAYIQDGAAGVCLFQSGGGTWPVPIHHRIVAKGLVAQRNGLTEVVPVSSADLYDLGATTPVTPVVATFSALLADAENYESTLVTVKNITFTGTWPAPGADANLAANDGTSNLTLSIDKDTNIDGTPAPTQPLTATGIFNQNDTTSPPYDSGYQLIPRSTADLTLLPVFLGGGITVDPSTGQPSLTFVTTNSIFGTTNGFQYRIVYKDDLLSTNKWLPVTDPDPGWTNSASGTITIQDPGAAGSTQRFYRIEAQ